MFAATNNATWKVMVSKAGVTNMAGQQTMDERAERKATRVYMPTRTAGRWSRNKLNGPRRAQDGVHEAPVLSAAPVE